MSTYKNCFELVKEVRQGLNEYSDALATGEEEGTYRNELLITLINRAIRQLFALIAKRRPNEFIRRTSLTGVDSVFTLPADFGKVLMFKDSGGLPINSITEDQVRLTGGQGYANEYYQEGRTLVLNRSGLTGPCTLVYSRIPRDVHQGKASAGDSTTITLDAKHARKIADHYVGMYLENVTKDNADAITAYTAARAATVGFTSAAGDFYALVPEIPEWAHILIAPMAIIAGKSVEISKEKPTKAEKDDLQELLITTFRQFATPDEDQSAEDLFSYQGPRSYGAFLL